MAGRYAAPLSFVGSANRIARWPQGMATTNPWAKGLAWTGAILLILLAWSFIVSWYVLVFGMFGLFVIPYRLIRRGQRQHKDTAETIRRLGDR